MMCGVSVFGGLKMFQVPFRRYVIDKQTLKGILFKVLN